jgi:hypothetical protein
MSFIRYSKWLHLVCLECHAKVAGVTMDSAPVPEHFLDGTERCCACRRPGGKFRIIRTAPSRIPCRGRHDIKKARAA